MNYVNINSKTHPDRYPLPNIEDIYVWLSGKKCFSKIDLLSGYWQVPVSEESQKYTAFITQDGLYEFKILPFGLRNAPSHFQRILTTILRPLLGKVCLVYIDDIIIFSDSPEQHVEHVKAVLDLLKEVEFQINLCKSKFFCTEIEFLGMIVKEGQVSVSKEKVQKIADLEPPNTVKMLRSFLGMTSYYRKYVKNYARIVQPMVELTRHETELVWTSKCN